MDEDKQYVQDVIKQYRLFDDLMMQKCFDDKAAAQELLNVILEKPFIVKSVTSQFETKPNGWHGAVFDILALDENGNQCFASLRSYREFCAILFATMQNSMVEPSCAATFGRPCDIEVQRADTGELVNRAEFYSAHLVTMALDTSEDYNKLRDTYVVFITETDVFKEGLPLYHIERYFRETRKLFGSSAHIVFVNGQWAGNDDVGRLMHDMKQTDAGKMYNKVLADRMRIFTETEEGVKVMSELTESIYNRGIEKGIEKGMSQKARSMAYAMLSDGMDVVVVARYTGLQLDEVASLQAK